jgi:hypothetical protein
VRGKAAILEQKDRLYAIPPPGRASGEGLLRINALPWGTVFLDGEELGDAPIELRLRAGRYRVRLVGPGSATLRDETVEIEAGQLLGFQNTPASR